MCYNNIDVDYAYITAKRRDRNYVTIDFAGGQKQVCSRINAIHLPQGCVESKKLSKINKLIY